MQLRRAPSDRTVFGKASRTSLLLVGLVSSLAVSCNAAIGAGAVLVLGGAGYLASQCYDRVRVRVFDRTTGTAGCEASVFVSDGQSERELRPCYNAALTAGKWTLTARRPGYVTASTEIVVPEHEGSCPSYTHTVEFMLRREGEPADAAKVTPPPARPAAPASAPAGDLDTPPSRIVPAPLPGVPTRSFEPVPAPPAPAPAPPPPAPSAPAPSPAPAPAPAPPAPAPPAAPRP